MQTIPDIENWFSMVNAQKEFWFYPDCEIVLDVLEAKISDTQFLKQVIIKSPKFHELACNQLQKTKNFEIACMQRYLAYLNQFA